MSKPDGNAICAVLAGMGKPHVVALVALGIIIAAFWFVVGRGPSDGVQAPDRTEQEGTGVVGGPAAPGDSTELDPDARVQGEVVYTPEDVEIFRETMEWARQERLDTLEMGEAMVRIGRRFVGDPYTPYLLDPPGPERLVVNLREFDCVTYVESVLALARVIQAGTPEFDAFTRELERIRYRGGRLDGYESRLHYFSEWIHDAGEKGLVRDVTAELGGEPEREPINFMSSNAGEYSKLEDNPERVASIRRTEEAISARPRHVIDQDRIADVADGIRNGDIIAASSSVTGLDIAHTGLALWLDGRLHLMHAPLVGSSVEISPRSLAARIIRIDGQDGIMVARPLPVE
ncbi:MAG TPA: N-acetylmuramoyl-L-alanine amidase-like domain-containing protein [Longimicrobiales bacterium]|nr:N-acetylmuramoyl-L-alanine amidase-like domain-containing protein [Longimicrobiales bacterium]